MPDLIHHFSHAATVIPVMDMEKSMAFYRDQLGFEITFTWEDPVSYAIAKAGENVQVHLTKIDQAATPPDRGMSTLVYIFVNNIDALYQAYSESGVTIKTPIGDQDYGMRDFDVQDPDGHILCFGEG